MAMLQLSFCVQITLGTHYFSVVFFDFLDLVDKLQLNHFALITFQNIDQCCSSQNRSFLLLCCLAAEVVLQLRQSKLIWKMLKNWNCMVFICVRQRFVRTSINCAKCDNVKFNIN